MKWLIRYKLAAGALLPLVVIAVSLARPSALPLRGYMAYEPAAPAFHAAYIAAAPSGEAAARFAGQLPQGAIVVAPARLVQGIGDTGHPLYPLYDASLTPEQLDTAFPLLPAEAVPGFGRAVYAADYADVRLLALDSRRLENGGPQRAWLQSQLAPDSPGARIAAADTAPADANWWRELYNGGVQTVWAAGDLYAADWAIAQPPAELSDSPYPGWKCWKPAKQAGAYAYTAAHMSGGLLQLQAMDAGGQAIDQLTLDTERRTKLDNAAKQAVSVIPPASYWRYRQGGDDLTAAEPEGFDVTGEHPVLQTAPLPPDDWRSPDFDDSGWPADQAPFGRSSADSEARQLQTQLDRNNGAPSYYFRKSFTLTDDPASIRRLLLNISFEDGFTAYLNGYEIQRSSIATGLLTPWSLAEPNEAVHGRLFDASGHIGKLAAGRNVLAVEVHLSHPKSLNLLFDSSLSVEK